MAKRPALTFVSDNNRPAFGLYCTKANRTGHPHRVAFHCSQTEGYMYVASEDCAGGFVHHRTIAEARQDYARYVKHWGGVPSDSFCHFIALDKYNGYVTHLANIPE